MAIPAVKTETGWWRRTIVSACSALLLTMVLLVGLYFGAPLFDGLVDGIPLVLLIRTLGPGLVIWLALLAYGMFQNALDTAYGTGEDG